MNQVTSASLRYPLSVFNKNSTLKWIHDQRIKVKDNTINGDCKQIILIGLGSEDYKGLSSMVQCDYLKSALMKCGRPVFIRRGGTASGLSRIVKGAVRR